MIETQLHSSGSIVLRLWGDLDWIAAQSLRHVMTDMLRPGIEVVVDLSHVASFDAVGISALVGSSRRARSVGCRLRIHSAGPEVYLLLERFCVQSVLATSVDDHNDAA
jgi:anti-anti-sigma factor